MQPIDMLSAFVIGGTGAFASALMMLIAMQGDRSARPALRQCLWGFLAIGVGLAQNAFTDHASRTPIFIGSACPLLGTALLARGVVALANGRGPRHPVAFDALVLVGGLALAWPREPHTYALVFHALSFAVAASMLLALRRALLAPRNAAESAVAVVVAIWWAGFFQRQGDTAPAGPGSGISDSATPEARPPPAGPPQQP